ncbi:phage tail protein, partial [Streptomyces sp. G3]|nr:phage tail protein [Streptomyces sp. G3]
RTVDILSDRMKKLTAAMEKAIEKGFGMKASGGIVGGSAATGGARGSWTLVGEHEPELVRLPFGSRVYSGPDTRRMRQQAWASMLNTPQRGSGPSAAAPTSAVDGRPLVLKVAIAEREFGEIWVDVGRKQVQTRGGLRATLGGLD